MTLPAVVFVDDEERILRSLRMLFRGRAEVLATTSGRQAIDWVRSRRVHVVVSDQRMPEMGGVEVLRAVAQHSPHTMRMLLTGYADLDAVTASVNDGEIYRFVEKPWDGAKLLASVLAAARVAEEDFADVAAVHSEPMRPSPTSSHAAQVLVLDSEHSVADVLHDILPASIQVVTTKNVESALGELLASDFAVIVAVLSSDGGDIVDAIKQLKRLRPATLVIAISPMRDSRLAIGLINEGQIFRFLLAPPVRELLRRCLISALERHAQLRATPRLQRRHDVQPGAPRAEATLSGRLVDVWRRLREVAGR